MADEYEEQVRYVKMPDGSTSLMVKAAPATRLARKADLLSRVIDQKLPYLTVTDQERLEMALNSVAAFLDLPPEERQKYVSLKEKKGPSLFQRVSLLRAKAKEQAEADRDWADGVWARMAAAEAEKTEEPPPEPPERHDPTRAYIDDLLRKE